jgi:hypothetical protein
MVVYVTLTVTPTWGQKHLTSPMHHGVHRGYMGAGGTLVSPTPSLSCSYHSAAGDLPTMSRQGHHPFTQEVATAASKVTPLNSSGTDDKRLHDVPPKRYSPPHG